MILIKRSIFLLVFDIDNSSSIKTSRSENIWLPEFRNFFDFASNELKESSQFGFKGRIVGDAYFLFCPKERINEAAYFFRSHIKRLRVFHKSNHLIRMSGVICCGDAYIRDQSDVVGVLVDQAFSATKETPGGFLTIFKPTRPTRKVISLF